MDKCRFRTFQCEDKRKTLFAYLQTACDDFPDYSSGDILYMVLRSLARQHGQSVSFLRTMTDDELFEEVDRMIISETIDSAVEESIAREKEKKERKRRKNKNEGD